MDILKKRPALLFHSSSRAGCPHYRKSWPFKEHSFLQRYPRRYRYRSSLNTISSSGVKQLPPFPPLSRILVFFQTCRSFSIRLKVGIDKLEQTSRARWQACPLRHGTAPALSFVFPQSLGFPGVNHKITKILRLSISPLNRRSLGRDLRPGSHPSSSSLPAENSTRWLVDLVSEILPHVHRCVYSNSRTHS
jgi:hypothetical protein